MKHRNLQKNPCPPWRIAWLIIALLWTGAFGVGLSACSSDEEATDLQVAVVRTAEAMDAEVRLLAWLLDATTPEPGFEGGGPRLADLEDWLSANRGDCATFEGISTSGELVITFDDCLGPYDEGRLDGTILLEVRPVDVASGSRDLLMALRSTEPITIGGWSIELDVVGIIESENELLHTSDSYFRRGDLWIGFSSDNRVVDAPCTDRSRCLVEVFDGGCLNITVSLTNTNLLTQPVSFVIGSYERCAGGCPGGCSTLGCEVRSATPDGLAELTYEGANQVTVLFDDANKTTQPIDLLCGF